jgi:hypothetical protein
MRTVEDSKLRNGKVDSPLSLLFRPRQKWMSESLPHSVCIKREGKLDSGTGKEWRYQSVHCAVNVVERKDAMMENVVKHSPLRTHHAEFTNT